MIIMIIYIDTSINLELMLILTAGFCARLHLGGCPEDS